MPEFLYSSCETYPKIANTSSKEGNSEDGMKDAIPLEDEDGFVT